MKNLILLEGGSYRGIYTSGVLDVFMEHDIYPDCILGVSAGRIKRSWLCSKAARALSGYCSVLRS